MRRFSLILCAALLLAVAAATPLAAPLALVALVLVALTRPARTSSEYSAILGAAPSSPLGDVVALILFRGPPADWFSVQLKMENLNLEEAKWARGVGFEPYPST